MSLFVIADLHLSFGVNKPMDIFGGWDEYVPRLETNWQNKVKPEDTVVLPGDLSWGMNFEQSRKDFEFLNKLNGRKIISKGNHDYWWNTKSKMDKFLSENGFDTIKILHNNHYEYEDIGICGTRGWINDNSEPADAKVLAREAGRLEMSIQSALKAGLKPLVFLHYPPVYYNSRNEEILSVMDGNAKRYAVNGEFDGVIYQLISSDFLKFDPLDITKIVQSYNL